MLSPIYYLQILDKIPITRRRTAANLAKLMAPGQ